MGQTKRLLGVFNFRFINAFRNGIFASFLGIYLRENLLLSVTESNALFTLLEFIGAIGQLVIWGYIADRYKARTALIIGAEAVTAVGYIGVYLIHKYFLSTSGAHAAGLSIVLCVGLLETAWGAGFVGFFALIGDIPDAKQRTKYMGYGVTIVSSGRICGSMLGGLFFDYKYKGGGFGEGILFYLLSSIILGFAVIAWFTRKDAETHDTFNNPSMDPSSEILISEPNQKSNQQHVIEEKISLRPFYWFLSGIALFSLGRGAITQISIFYFRLPVSIEASSQMVSLLITAHWIGYMVFGPIAGRMSGRYATIGFLASLSWFATIPFLYMLVDSFPWALVLFASRGIAMSTFIVSAFTIIIKLVPSEKRGRLLGQYNATSMMAWGIGGSVVGGPIADWRFKQGVSLSSAYITSFFAASLLGLGAIIITLWKSRDALRNP